MRLIDADKLIAKLKLSECHSCQVGGDYCVDCKAIDAHKVLDEIINQPIADVEKLASDAYKEGWSDALSWMDGRDYGYRGMNVEVE